MSKIIALKAENVKRLQAVEIRPDGNMVVIGGNNGQGKTSVLDAITYTLAGKAACCDKPIRNGQTRGEVSIETDDYVITRTFTEAGGNVKVTNKDGARYDSPQGLLNKLCGTLAFDPLKFMQQDSRSQAETLKVLVGIDFSTLDLQRAEFYAERTAVNHHIKNLEGQLAGMPEHSDVPAELLSMSELLAKLDAAQAINQQSVDRARYIKAMETESDNIKGQIAHAESQIDAWRKKLETLEASLAETQSVIRDNQKIQFEFKEADVQGIQTQIEQLESTNQKIRENQAKANVEVRLEDARGEAKILNERINSIDDKKAKKLAETQFPVDGLCFDGEGVTFNGVPLSQASGAEQLRVSAAIAAAMNPQLRVMMIRDGSLLDEKSLQMLSDFAAVNDFQIWLEVVSTDAGKCSVIIEDGMVKK
ncbi:MAG TPA: AAA family ATPase [Phycisphaerae bacterium]|nr:AAA family ATPase [Phycisphaerae bacterium]